MKGQKEYDMKIIWRIGQRKSKYYDRKKDIKNKKEKETKKYMDKSNK